MNDTIPTPITDAATFEILSALQSGKEKVVYQSIARDLERSLAERTEESGKWANLAAQYSADREHNANMALAYKAERDTALAKLAECKKALTWVAESRSGHASTLARY